MTEYLKGILSRAALASVFLACIFMPPPSGALETRRDLTKLSLEELMNIEVTSPSKKEEALFDTPAAVYVITGDDIRRSGLRSIPEALRMAPGVQVARNRWQ